MIRSCLVIVVLLLSLAGLRAPAPTLTIANATVVDVVDGTLHPGTTVVIDGNRIVRVGPASTVGRIRGRVVDAHGLYVLPGLWDMHTHTFYSTTREVSESYVLPLFVANGITGIRDMGSRLDDVLRARSEVAAHQIVGPRMIVAGPMLDGPAARSRASMPIATAEDATKAVDSLADSGVDFIKVVSGVPRDAYFAVAAEAAARAKGTCRTRFAPRRRWRPASGPSSTSSGSSRRARRTKTPT
ncbi:MAG TPA: amidohydrolase family protein [Vicinamibacterales bacterium]|nr:amidohydrolase family protein [Vicinamibacterales bacterium]